MAIDAELERLKAEQDRAFERKQQSWQTQDRAWNKREQIKAEMDRAHQDKQRAYDAQQVSWQRYQQIRSSNGPRIDSLNAQQESAFQNMKRAFDNASSAHDRRDGASARRYADEGHRYKAQSQQCVAERRRLVEEIRSAKMAHEPAKQQFQQAKLRFDEVKRRYDSAKVDHLRARDDFQQAKSEFDRAKKAFHSRLDILKAQTKQRDKDKRFFAEKAGVPMQYRNKVYVSKDADGNVNLYFGGVGKPNGPGHGHYVMDKSGKVTYKRDPFDPHGTQNFTENRRESITLAVARHAMDQYAISFTTPRQVQYEDGDFKVIVKSGHDRRHNCIVTDIIIADKHNKREHYHIVVDQKGNELISEWRINH